MRTRLLVALLLSAATPALVAGQGNPSAETSRRVGMWFTAGLGVGVGNDIGGGSGNVAFGWTLSRQFLLGVGSSDWRMGFDRTTLTMGTVDLRAQFYPEAEGGFTTFINRAAIHTPDPRGSVGQIGVGLTLH